MKKLLFTAIAAAGMAFGLRAELEPDGTSFEGVTAPVPLADAASMTKLGSGSFTLPTEGDPTLTVTAYGQGEALEHVDAYGTGAQANYLAVKTSFGNPLTWNLATPTAADGIYFDSLVKFTAMDADDTVQAGEEAKLAVYLKNNADETETHVFVHAGTLGGAAQEYDCGAITDADAWHRLTIKTIDDDIAGVAFVVFIDKVALKCNTSKGFGDLGTEAAFWNGANALFPSLLPDDSTIASVGFDGQGGIDDIVLTSTAPDFVPVAAALTVTYGKGLTSIGYQVGTASGSVTAVADGGSFTVPYDSSSAATVTLAITPAANWGVKEVTAEDADASGSGNAWTISINAGTGAPTATIVTKDISDKLAVTIDGQTTNYPDFASAIAAINDTLEPGQSASIQLIKDVEVGGSELAAEAVISGDITIDLNGKTITGTVAEAYVFDVAAGQLTIKDTSEAKNGKVDATACAGAAYVFAGAKIIAQGGIFDGQIDLAEADVDEQLPAGDASIVAGTFAGTEGGFYLASKVAQGSTVGEYDNGYYVVSEQTGPFSGGTGTAADPYQIANADDLKALADFVADGSNTVGVCFLQTADIVWKDADGSFPGIGAANKANDTTGAFQGTYDGGNKTIKDILFCAATSGQTTTYRGVFNKVANATIKNLVVDTVKLDSTMTTANEIGGALVVGNAAGTTTFQNVTSKGYWNEPSDIANGATHNLAGICCRIDATKVYFIACTNEAALYCKYTKCGGMVSYAQCDVDFTNCCNKGTLWMNVNATLYKDPHASGVGGMIGMPTGNGKTITFTGCVNSGLIGGDHGGDAAKLNKGQLIGATNNSNPTLVDNGGNIGRDDLPSFGSSQGTTTTPDTKFAFQFATGNGDGTVTFCDTPAAVGSYKVMGKNALAISFGTAEGDQLVLDATVADYSGTVTSAVDGMDAVASVEGKITTYTIHEPIAAIKLTVTYDANITQVKVGETVVSASGTEIDVMPGSPYAITVTGKDFYQFAFGTLTGCAEQDVTGLAITINSDAAAASMAITATKYDPQDIADDPRPASSIAADLGIMNGKAYLGGYGLTDKQRLAKVVTWGETKGSLADINKIAFNNREEDLPDQGTGPKPVNKEAEAFLLDCAVSELETAKAAFKIPAFEIDAEGNVSFGAFEDGGDYGNGHLKQLGATAVDGDYTEDCENPNFFKFELQK